MTFRNIFQCKKKKLESKLEESKPADQDIQVPLKDSNDIKTPPTPTFHEEDQLDAVQGPHVVVFEQPEIADEHVKEAAAAEQESKHEESAPEEGDQED